MNNFNDQVPYMNPNQSSSQFQLNANSQNFSDPNLQSFSNAQSDTIQNVNNNNTSNDDIKDTENNDRSRSRNVSQERSVSSVKKRWCCDKCKKSDKMNGKACVCVVPRSQRRIKLDSEGCRTCGCKGCTKEDREYFDDKGSKSGKRRKTSFREDNRKRSDRENHKRRRRNSENSVSESEERNFKNFEKSPIWNILYNHLNCYPPLFGMGIPQRTRSYIRGEP